MGKQADIEDRLDALLYYVPTGTTEGERHILRESFVQTEDYREIITPPPGSPRLLVGKKGSGKSAIVDFSIDFLKSSQVPAILVKPMDLDLDGMNDQDSSGTLTRTAYRALLSAVCSNIGQQLSGFLHGDAETLYDEAVSTGARDRDFVGKLSRCMARLASPLAAVNFTELFPSEDRAASLKLERSLRGNIAASNGAFYLFVDDTDQVAKPGTAGHVNRIWAMLLAARELAMRVQQVRIVVSLRDEVWRNLSREEVSQRDQWDHFLPLVFLLNPSLDHVQQIIERRLVLAAHKFGVKEPGAQYQLFFEGQSPRMPTSRKRSSWPDIIRTRSRERPRDAVQLVNMLAKKAKSPRAKRINEEILAEVMPKYSEERVALLAQEYENECPRLRNIIRSFSRVEFSEGSFLADTETVRNHLRSLPSEFSITLAGVRLQARDDSDALRLWQFLYSIGFLNARVSDERAADGYRFVSPSDDLLFVHPSRWNEMQKALWEVHPSFRDYLMKLNKDHEAQFGLPRKSRKHGRTKR